MDIEQVISQIGASTKLEVDIPLALVLQIEGVEGYVKTKLVGMEPDNFLIIASPRANLTVRDRLSPGSTLVISYLHRGSLFSFQSTVLHYIESPYKLIFISYPKIVSRKELRQSERVDCYLSANALVKEVEIKGTLVDLSAQGCRLVVKKADLASQKAVVEPEESLELTIFKGMDEASEEFTCIIRNKKDDNNLISLGLQFKDLESDQKSFLNDIVENLEALADIKEE